MDPLYHRTRSGSAPPCCKLLQRRSVEAFPLFRAGTGECPHPLLVLREFRGGPFVHQVTAGLTMSFELSGAAMEYEAFKADQHRIFHEILAREPMRGIRELLDALALAAVPVAIASTSTARWVVPAVERLGLSDRFRTIVTADDVERRKPAPDVYLEAARRLGADPRRSVAIEDSGPGVAAATAAGMKTIAIPHWLTERHDLAGATLRVAHAGELTVEVLKGLACQP